MLLAVRGGLRRIPGRAAAGNGPAKPVASGVQEGEPCEEAEALVDAGFCCRARLGPQSYNEGLSVLLLALLKVFFRFLVLEMSGESQ